jgi:general secretion pathway protein G
MRKAFTLIELIVVIAIIAVLAAIVAPNAFKAIEKGKISAMIGDYKALKTSSMAYYSDLGAWPENTTNGAGFINNTTASASNSSSWDGPYLEKWPARTPWGGNYTFNNSSAYDWTGDGKLEQARYLMASGVPSSGNNNGTAGKIDLQIDGSMNNSTGSVAYDSTQNPTILRLLVSYD